MKSTAIHNGQSEDNLEGIKSLAKTSPDNSPETRTDELSETSSFLKVNNEFKTPPATSSLPSFPPCYWGPKKEPCKCLEGFFY